MHRFEAGSRWTALTRAYRKYLDMGRWLEEHGGDETREKKFSTHLHSVLIPLLEAARVGPDAEGYMRCRNCRDRTILRVWEKWPHRVCPECRGEIRCMIATPGERR